MSLVTVDHGDATAIAAAADMGYAFADWTVLSGSAVFGDANSASTTVTLTSGDATVRANFADPVAPAAPVITGSSPGSPSFDLTPFINGMAEADSTVTLYPSGNCSGPPLFSGIATAGAFSIEFTVQPNLTTTISATATDAAENTSVCSNAIAYTHDDMARRARDHGQ